MEYYVTVKINKLQQATICINLRALIEEAEHNKTCTVWFHLHEVQKTGKDKPQCLRMQVFKKANKIIELEQWSPTESYKEEEKELLEA